MPLSGDDLNAWLQDHAIAIFGRALNPALEVPTWGAYFAYRGAEQTVLNFWTQKDTPGAKTYPA
jgi:hypothetical protein